jgi:D-aspartate ligase
MPGAGKGEEGVSAMTARSRPTVFVTTAHAKASLPLMESLCRGGMRVAAGSPKRFNAGFMSRYCRERCVYPSPRFRPADFQEWLIRFLCRRKIEMLFPVGNSGTVAVSEIQDEVRRHTLLLLPEHPIFMTGYAKTTTLKAATAAGVPIPDTWYPHDHPGGVEGVLSEIRSWPVLVKPSIGTGARGIVRCREPDELRRHFPQVEAKYGESYVQDFVPPGKMQYKVDMLVDAKQRLLAGVVYGKSRMYPPDGGSSVLNFSADRPDILDYAWRMLAHLNWVGFCDFDFVDDPRDDVAKLMEINPRPPESFRMGPWVGIDFPMMMYRLAHGEQVKPVLDYPKHRFLRFLFGDLLWFVCVDHHRRFHTWPNWFRFYDRETAHMVGSVRDPGPIIGYLLENVAMVTNGSFWTRRLRRLCRASEV